MNQKNFSTSAPIIRPRRDLDIPEAAAALVEVHATDGYPVEGVDHPEVWLTPPGLIQAWIAELEGSVVGHVAVSRSNGEEAVSLWLKHGQGIEEKTAVMARLFVIRGARKSAIGERLVRAATEYAEQKGTRLVLDVMAKDTAAIRLYERLGWQKLGLTTHAYGDGGRTDAVCYASPATSAA
ncbi:GNAT family N-acetyltransferase [Streptomyces liliifuscus]|uniref:GNAT family N-acetyltransferase n=1 Tax=Streptomyces liliifuscus TaxID=2797636 RepID=A0A7T7I8A0_9ACTN|nr:GNAT family N-acetyltransferase [Streptomyces liliifuscus]QQM42731.1 GNAT family N-acetyltransferase [Streptomyces liliifuscus]